VTIRSGRARSVAAGPATARKPSSETGMVTAEFAVALPAFVLVVLAALSGVAVMTAQLRCEDTADIAARMAARGDGSSLVQTTALRGAPGRAQLEVVTTTSLVMATVRARISPLGLSRFLPGVAVSATVVEAREPTVASGG
jgi:Flp pilus assembly protein TadG